MKNLASISKSFLIILAIVLSNFLSAQTPELIRQQNGALSFYGFMENKGQVKDQNNHIRQDIRYIYSGKNFNLVLKDDGFSYELFRFEESPAVSEATGEVISFEEHDVDLMASHSRMMVERFDANFIGIAAEKRIAAEGKSTDYANYYSGNNLPEVSQVYAYKKVIYYNIYPKIDLEFIAPEANDIPLRYQFVVHPGGRVKDISIKYNALHGLQMIDGDLLLTGSFGFVKEENLFCYQQDKGNAIPSSFVLNSNVLSFKVGHYDRLSALIIDPDIVWGTYYGDDFADDHAKKIIVDPEGNLLVTGETASTSNFTTTGAFQTTYGGGMYDAFVMKWNPSGSRYWVTYYGGNDRDCSFSVYADAGSNVYCAGDTKSSNMFVQNAHQPTFGGMVDVFFFKLNRDGFMQWATYYGGSAGDHNDGGIVGDRFGNIYLCGWTESFDNISTPDSYQPAKGLIMDAFLAKFNSDGMRLWATYYGGDDEDRAHAFAVDLNNNLYMSGTTPSLNAISTVDAPQPECGGGVDIFIVKFTAEGMRLWGTYYGGSEDEHGRECDIDAEGNYYMTGYTASENNIATHDAWQPNWSEGYNKDGSNTTDACYVKYTPNGVLLYGTYLGGSGLDYGRSLRLQTDGSIIIVGSTQSGGLGTNGVFQKIKSVGKDAFIAKFKTNGQLDWFTYYGGEGTDEGEEMDIDANNNIYITGSVSSTTGIATPGAYKSLLTNNTADECMIACFVDRCYDRYESNNTINTATSIIIPESNTVTVNSEIGLTGDKDFFAFMNTAANPNLSILLSNLPADYDIYLYGPAGKVVKKSLNRGLMDEQIIFNTTVVGLYKIKVQGYTTSTFNDTVCYDLTVSISAAAFRMNENAYDEFSSGAYPDEFVLSGEINGLKIYPNPTSQQLYLELPDESDKHLLVRVYDLHGRQVFQQSQLLAGILNIDISRWEEGMYLLILHSGEKVYTRKILVSR